MFCIYKDKLFIAEPNLPYSHAIWFEKQGWISKENDDLMNKIIRGIIENNGDISFYIGYDFQINDEIESIFFNYLKELVEKLNLPPNTKLFGGWIKPETENTWNKRKEYGEVQDIK